MSLKKAEATKCFVCNSHENPECVKADPGKLFEKDCADKKGGVDAVQCRKIKQVIEFSVNGCELKKTKKSLKEQ